MRFWPYILILLPFGTLAQISKMGNKPVDIQTIDKVLTRSYFNTKEQISTDNASVLEFVKQFAKYKGPNHSYELLHRIESPKAYHLLFQQYYEGVKVYRGQVKVNLDKSGNVLSIFDNSLGAVKASEQFPPATVTENIINNLYPDREQLVRATPEHTWFWDGESFVPAVRIEFVDNVDQFYEVIIKSTEETVYQRDLNSYYHTALDSPSTAKVFLPDPLTTAEEYYGTPYEDSNDADINQLNLERHEVIIDANFESGEFSLTGPYCNITDFSPPSVQPANKTSPNFDYTRAEDGFEDVNTFYHINQFQAYVQLFGFNNLANYPIDVDCHALNGSDNSNFNAGFGTPRLSFGEGGVDDAEDADVIIHEYGHALSYSAAPNTNNGFERQALDEAIGDYLCSSYSRSISEFRWEDVFTWDGHNEFWNGRSVVTTDHYPEDLGGNIHLDADIWAATLMQIWEDIGREPTDAIQLQSMYSYATNMSMSDAAHIFLQADELYYGGVHAWPITYWMVERGLLPPDVSVNDVSPSNSFRLLNSAGFTNGTGQTILQFPSIDQTLIEIYDISGKLLQSHNIQNTNRLYLNSENFKAGIYILSAQQNGEKKNFKLVKKQ